MARLKMNKKKVTPAGKLARRVYDKMQREYKNSHGVVFMKGDVVRLNGSALRLYTKQSDDETLLGNAIDRARIFSLLPDLKGVVVLSTPLGGYWTWSVEDLEHVV